MAREHRTSPGWSCCLLACACLLGPSPARSEPARAAWTYETLGAVWARPWVAPDGRIFVGSEDGFFYAFAPGGRVLWTYKASHGFSGWPVPFERGLAAGNRNGKLYLFSLTGELLGNVALGGAASGPPVLLGKLLLVPTVTGSLVAVRDRRLRWSHPAGSPISGWPVAAPGGRRVYVGCADGSVLALDEQGRRLFRASVGSTVANGMVPLRDGLLLATTAGEVLSLDEKGAVRWRQRFEATDSGLAAAPSGAVLATVGGHLLALDEKGRVAWRLEADGPIRSMPGASDRVIFGTDRGSVFILDREGRPLGLLQASGPIRGGIVLAGGRVIFGAQDRRLYVLPDPTVSRPRPAPAWREPLARTPRGELLWRRDLSGPLARGVAAGPGGKLIAATHGKRVFTLEAGGDLRWSYSCGEDIDTLPAAGTGGEVFFGCSDGGFYGLRPDGEMRFRFPVNKGLSSSPAVTRDGTVYFGAGDKRFYALAPDGKPRWRILTGDEIESAPRIAPDGMVYVGSDDRHLYAISPLGQVSWYYRTDGAVRSQPAVAREGGLYVTSFDQQLHAVSPEGSAQWTYQTDGQLFSSPALSPDGRTIYFGSRDQHLYAVSAQGQLRWRFPTGGEVDSDPAVDEKGEIYVGSDDGNLYVLSPEGQLRWYYPAGAEIRGALLPRADRSVVVGTMAGAVLALRPPGGAPEPKLPGVRARVPLGRGRVGPTLLADDGSLVIAGSDGVVRAVGADRWPSWAVRVGDTALGRPAAAPDGSIFVTDGSGNLAALTRDGLRFRLRLDRQRLSPPALLGGSDGGLVLVGSAAGRVWAVTGSGKVRWFHAGAWPVSASPVAFQDGSGRAAVAGGPELTILDGGGQVVASAKQPGPISAGPVAVGRVVVIGDGLGMLSGFGSDGARRWQRDLGAGVREVGSLPDGSATALTDDGRLWRVADDGEPLGTLRGRAPVRVAGPAADGLDLLVAQADHSLWRIDGRSGEPRRLLELPDPAVALLRGRGETVLVTADGQVTWLEAAREPPGSRRR